PDRRVPGAASFAENVDAVDRACYGTEQMRIRTFVALNLSIGVVRRVAEEVEKARATVGSVRVAWVAPANLHVTLFFCGSVEEELVAAMSDRLRSKLADFKPFAVKCQGFGCLPSHERPCVRCVGVDDG